MSGRVIGTRAVGPVVIHSNLHSELKERLHAVLLALDVNPHFFLTLATLGLERFAPEVQALRECERLLSNWLSRSDSPPHSSGSTKRIEVIFVFVGSSRRQDWSLPPTSTQSSPC